MSARSVPSWAATGRVGQARRSVMIGGAERSIVTAAGATFAAHLLDLAIMQLRLNVNDISAEELSGLSDYVGAEFVRDKSSH